MALCAALALAAVPVAAAEMSEIHVSRQYGISYLPRTSSGCVSMVSQLQRPALWDIANRSASRTTIASLRLWN